MSTPQFILVIVVAVGAIAWLAFHFGAGLGIPLFRRWSDQLETRNRNRWKRSSICFDTDGITISDLLKPDKEPLHLRWLDIERLTLYKADLITTDMICLRIEGDGGWVDVDEEMDGWKALIDALPNYLRGCKSLGQWFSGVAFPAFAPNPTEIYRRQPIADGIVDSEQ